MRGPFRSRSQSLSRPLRIKHHEFLCVEFTTATHMVKEIISNPQEEQAEASTRKILTNPQKEQAEASNRTIFTNQQEDEMEAPTLSHDHESLPTDAVRHFALASSLKACTRLKDLHTGRKLHADIAAKGLFHKDIFLGGAVVHMYAKCGDLIKAQEVFDDLPGQNVVSWTALIVGYAQHGQGEEALHYFERMQLEGFAPDAVTFASILKACGSIGAVDKGIEIHDQIAKNGLLRDDIVVGTALVDMYTKCGCLRKAQEVFDELPVRNLVTWNILITGYAQQGHIEEALAYFERMQGEGFSPDRITYSGMLKAFGSNGAILKGQEIHSQVVRNGLLVKDVVIGNALVDMYSKCGALEKAQLVFDELPCRSVVSWTALIVGYAQRGEGEESLNLFERMQHEGLSPDQVTFACILKACGSTGAAAKGREIHVQLVREGLLGNDIILGTALVEMYAKCGAFSKADEVFIELKIRNVVLWNALIGGYVQHEHGEPALECFTRMHSEGILPDVATFGCILKACGCIGAERKGRQMHAQIMSCGVLESSMVLVNTLIAMYAKCNLLEHVQMVVEHHGARDLGMWNAMIVGLVQNSYGEEAVSCFKQMLQEAVFPDATTRACVIRACGTTGAVYICQELHAQIIKDEWLGQDVQAANVLIDMYAKCNAFRSAREVFDSLLVKNIASWNGLIAGCAQHGRGEEALRGYERMLCEGFLADASTFASVFKACSSMGVANKGVRVHAQMAGDKSVEKDVILCTAVLDMYSKCGLFGKALDMFDGIVVRDVVSWNALVAGYVQHELHEEALKCFEQMQWEGICPDTVTFLAIAKSCGSIGSPCRGQEIHAEIVRAGLQKTDVLVGNAMVDMYIKCGLIEKAEEVFEGLPERNIISWNVLISGYAQHSLGVEALLCFERLQQEGYSPDRVTFLSILKACGSIGFAARCDGQATHSMIVKVGLPETDFVLGTALVDMHAKCGMLDEAQKVFEKLPNRDVVSWNALANGFVQHMHGEEALHSFERMQREGASPDSVTFVCLLKACGSVGAAYKGQEVHGAAVRAGLELDTVVGNAVVDMYANCGMLAEAQDMFENLFDQDVVSWNAVISGYAQLGEVQVVFELLDKMLDQDEVPDSITLTLALNSCSHSGLLKEGQMCFQSMGASYGVRPDVEHYSCMVDLFGRAGQIDKAAEVIEWMPFSASLAVWHALLGACQKWDNVELGDWAFNHVIQLDELDVGAYICLSNIYAGRNH